MAQAKFGRYESVYDLEETCFRNYRETVQTIQQTTGNITDAEWGRNHALHRKDAIRGFDENCGHFKKQDLVRKARESLIERIETENLDLIKLYELRTMNQAMQESLQESKATTDKSRETVTQLKSVREEQNKTLEENNARLDRLSSQQSNAREQYSNMSKELAGVEEYMAKLERQRQDQKREQQDLEEQARRNAMRLEELKKLSEEKQKNKFKWPSFPSMPWSSKSKKVDDMSQIRDIHLGHGFDEDHRCSQRDPHQYTENNARGPPSDPHQYTENNARGPPVCKESYDPQRYKSSTYYEYTSYTPRATPADKSPIWFSDPNIGGNVTQKSSISSNIFQSTKVPNPATADESGTDSNPKLDSSSTQPIVNFHQKIGDHTDGNDNVGNILSEMSILTKETTSLTGMNSNYSVVLEESPKPKKRHTEPNRSHAKTDVISENHNTGLSSIQNQMVGGWDGMDGWWMVGDGSGKNNSSSKVVTISHVNFDKSDKSQNPENVTQNLTDNIHEIPESVSKDDDLLDLGNKEDNNSDATIDGIKTSDSKNKSLISTETQQDLSLINFEPNAETISVPNKDENVEASKYNMPPVDDTLVTPETKFSESTSVTQISTSEIDTTSKSTNPFGAFYQLIKNPVAKFPPKNAERVTGSGQTPNEYSVQLTEGVESFNQDDKHNQQPLENLSHENSPEEQQTNGFKIVNLI